MPRKYNFNLPGFLAGAAIGAGWMMLHNRRARLDPLHTTAQRRIDRALNRTLHEAHIQGELPLNSGSRYVIFSDHHKGARNRADDFQQCEQTYLQALDYYFQEGFSLIVLGDAEELWEETIPAVMTAYRGIFISEARFHPDRYYKVIGNHDNLWENANLVAEHLHSLFPGLQLYSGLVLSYRGGPHISGKLFLTHGHQGTLDADIFNFLPPLVLPLYRDFQNLTGLGRTTPAQDDCLRAEHDTQMYRWASRQGKMLLIAGHTHRPVWSSKTHLEKLIWQLQALLSIPEDQRPDDYEQQVYYMSNEIKTRQQKHPPCTDTIKTRPTYFNTGCCRFSDGDITGIEIQGSQLRLIRWSSQEKHFGRVVLEEMLLDEVFTIL